jgi:hypothetical protein
MLWEAWEVSLCVCAPTMGRRGGTPILLIASRKTGQFGDADAGGRRGFVALGKIEGLLLSHGTTKAVSRA